MNTPTLYRVLYELTTIMVLEHSLDDLLQPAIKESREGKKILSDHADAILELKALVRSYDEFIRPLH